MTTIPNKRFLTIGEASVLCAVKQLVLRFWDLEFEQLAQIYRRGNRRYYQRHDVLMIRQIRSLLYDHGFTIGGARQRLSSPEVSDEGSQFKQLIRQMVVELEDVVKLLRT